MVIDEKGKPSRILSREWQISLLVTGDLLVWISVRMLLRLVLGVEVSEGRLRQCSCLNVRDVWLHLWLIAYTVVNVFIFRKHLSFL